MNPYTTTSACKCSCQTHHLAQRCKRCFALTKGFIQQAQLPHMSQRANRMVSEGDVCLSVYHERAIAQLRYLDDSRDTSFFDIVS